MSAAVAVTRQGPSLWATLDRPQALNAITPDTVRGLHAALDAAEGDDGIRVLVIAASGTAFCAGADLTQVGNGGLSSFLADVGALLTRIEASPVPVIAAVHGLAIAGGLEIALACDFVIAARSAAFGDGHANYGLLPGGGGSVRLPLRVGPGTARRMMYTAAVIPAAELAHTDLVSELVDDEDLDSRVHALVAEIAAKSPLGIARMKRLVADGLRLPAAEALNAELAAVAEHATSADFAEGLAAFGAKRVPQFTGR
ncbi:Crotonyl-CoA hydratase [Paraconexibacter sp. AEG42_29]|uniref:Crotonyl-CoA hydratase n=1 Tax=Paraconexibacter sp. AEG42_29 TaxID=2997339 RepID=A0AAU7AY02_9ACTN